MSEEEKKELNNLICMLEMHHIDSTILFEIQNLIKSQQKEIEKKDEIINILFDERNYIINNLETDLNRKGIYSEAKGQISQILEYYKNNDKYFEKKVEDINDK